MRSNTKELNSFINFFYLIQILEFQNFKYVCCTSIFAQEAMGFVWFDFFLTSTGTETVWFKFRESLQRASCTSRKELKENVKIFSHAGCTPTVNHKIWHIF